MFSRFLGQLRSHPSKTDQGFSFTEGIIATVIFSASVAVGLPTFMQFQLEAATNEDRVGAVSVSQQLLDSIRSTDISSLPTSGTTTVLPDGTSTNNLSYRGQNFDATITYCETAELCDANARQIVVQVSQNGKDVYAVETLYTRFD